MKLSVPAAGLRAALSRVSEAVARKTPNPIHKCVLVRATLPDATVAATDLELAARVRLDEPEVSRAGAAAVSAETLAAIVAEAGPEKITLELVDHTLRVRYADARYELPTQPADEFPEMPVPDGGHKVTVKAGALRALIRLTAFAADRHDAARYVLSAVLVEPDKGLLRLVATDSKRVAVAEADAVSKGRPDTDRPHLLPVKAVSLIERNLPDDDTEVVLTLRPNEVFAEFSGTDVHARLLEGKFPPWEKVLPKKLPTLIALPRREFAAAVRSAAILTDAAAKRVEFAFEAGKLTLSSKVAEKGASQVDLALPGYAGGPVAIAFDPLYVSEYLKAADGDGLTLELEAGDRPALFRCGDRSRYVVMPLAG